MAISLTSRAGGLWATDVSVPVYYPGRFRKTPSLEHYREPVHAAPLVGYPLVPFSKS